MILYTAQTLFLGALLLCATLSVRRLDAFLTAFVCLWTVGVVAIYWKYGTAQDLFYSDDQRIQVGMVDRVTQDPLLFSLSQIIELRYVLTFPASLLTRIGVDPLLALKFLQAIFFVLIYRLVREHFRIENLRFKMWYSVMFCGPLVIFMSLLGLRDLPLAYFSLYLLIGRDTRIHAVSWLGLFLLRPHLAIAFLIGRMFGLVMSRVRTNYNLLILPLIVVVSFIAGTYAYVVGRHFQFNGPLNFESVSHLWSQSTFTRLFANFGGLQFLLFGSDIVNLSVPKLFLLRILFFDTFLIPILFLWTLLSTSKHQRQSLGVLASFAFFLGLISTTDFNSSRQNIPFLALMGVTVVLHLANRVRAELAGGPEALKQSTTAGTSLKDS